MITSTSNARVKNLIQLKKKARERKKQGVFVAEGLRIFREIPKERLDQVYVSETFLRHHEKELKGISCEVLSDEVFDHISDTRTPQGILSLVRMADHTDIASIFQKDGMWLMLENIQDPGNLGTMFRAGEGAGVTGIIMNRNTADVYSPKVIRSTMGSIFRVPFIIADDLAAAAAWLKRHDVAVYAAYLNGSVCYDEPDYRKGCAFLIGNEGNGLTPEAVSLADCRIRIPMQGQLESLNAAVAASLLMYECSRQRRRQDR